MLGELLKELNAPQQVEVDKRVFNTLMDNIKEEREISVEPGIWFNVSEVSKLCPRLLWLIKRTGKKFRKEIDQELIWVGGIGSGYHSMLQNRIFPHLPDGVLQGWWLDNEKHAIIKGEQYTDVLQYKWIPRPDGDSDFRRYTFVEPYFRNSKYRIKGRCDGFFVWPEHVEVFDIKTVSDRSFEYLNPAIGGKPRPGDVIQVRVYMWLAGVKHGRIIYVSRSGNTLSKSFYEHIINYDEATIDMVKERLLSCIEVADTDVDEIPRLDDCRYKSRGMARYCDLRDECFRK